MLFTNAFYDVYATCCLKIECELGETNIQTIKVLGQFINKWQAT